MSAAAQAAFAGLDVATKYAELHRSVASLGGEFAKKISHTKAYWYY